MALSLFMIFALGYMGYRIFNFFRIPGGTITGSLIFLAIVTSLGYEWVEPHSFFTTFLQIIVGITIGHRFKKQQMHIFKSYLIPGLISSIWMISASLIVGYLLAKFTDVDLGTALYGSVPAGLSEIGLLALSLDLDVPVVTLLQFVRYISICFTVPIIVSRYGNENYNKQNDCSQGTDIVNKKQTLKFSINIINWHEFFQILLVLFFGSVGGFTAKGLGIPVGAMLGSMAVVGFLNIIGTPFKELPHWLILTTQIFLGGYLGTTFLPEVLFTLKSLFFPILLFSFIIVLNGIILGFIMYKFFKWDLTTALLSTSAGGLALMTLTAIEMNADPVKVSIIQTFRVVTILLIMPSLILYIIN